MLFGEIVYDLAGHLGRVEVVGVCESQESRASGGVERGAPVPPVVVGLAESGVGQPDIRRHAMVNVRKTMVATDHEGGSLKDARVETCLVHAGDGPIRRRERTVD